MHEQMNENDVLSALSQPELPLASNLHVKHRYEPVVKQFTRLIMKHGRLSTAQRVGPAQCRGVPYPIFVKCCQSANVRMQTMAYVLEHMKKSPPPMSPHPGLLSITGSVDQLNLDPIRCLTLAIDSVAPLMRIRSQRGLAGGGVALQIPVPLGLRQRRRRAINWIVEAANNKRSKGSGKTSFANKIADEVMSVIEGRSTAWEKRNAVHRLGVSARANLLSISPRRGRIA